YEVMYINKEGQIRFTQYNPMEMFVSKDNKDNIEFACRPYTIEDIDNNKIDYVEVYDDDAIRLYVKNGNQYNLVHEKEHHFKEIPVCIYKNNDEELGDYEQQI